MSTAGKAPSAYVLPDILAPGLHIVFVGTVAGRTSQAQRHYYANPSNRFWRRLHETGLTPRQLDPFEDTSLPGYGIGLTDLNKTDASSRDRGVSFDVADFLARLADAEPARVVFNGKKAAQVYCRHVGLPRRPSYGLQGWSVGDSDVFVVPQSSGMNWDARVMNGSTTVQWWQAMRTAVAP